MPLFGARGGSPPAGGNRGNRRRGAGGGGTRVVTVYKSNDGIYKPSRGRSSRGGGGPRGRGRGGRGVGQGRGGGRGRGRGGGHGRGRGGKTEQGPSFVPEGKTWNDLTSEEKDDVTRQRNEWKAAQLDKDLVSFMAKGGKTDVAASLLDDDLEAYKRQGSKKKSEQPVVAQADQQGAEPMEQ